MKNGNEEFDESPNEIEMVMTDEWAKLAKTQF